MLIENCSTCKYRWKDRKEDPCSTCVNMYPTSSTLNWEPVPALSKQVGGDHYKDKKIQPIEYIHANNLGFCVGNVIKYVTRYKDKNGIADLEKAKHYIELLIELENKNVSSGFGM